MKNRNMKIFKYILIIQFLMSTYFLVKFIITPSDKMITIQLSVWYIIMLWATFGMIYATMIIAKNLNKFGNTEGNEEKGEIEE